MKNFRAIISIAFTAFVLLDSGACFAGDSVPKAVAADFNKRTELARETYLKAIKKVAAENPQQVEQCAIWRVMFLKDGGLAPVNSLMLRAVLDFKRSVRDDAEELLKRLDDALAEASSEAEVTEIRNLRGRLRGYAKLEFFEMLKPGVKWKSKINLTRRTGFDGTVAKFNDFDKKSMDYAIEIISKDESTGVVEIDITIGGIHEKAKCEKGGYSGSFTARSGAETVDIYLTRDLDSDATLNAELSHKIEKKGLIENYYLDYAGAVRLKTR